MEAILSFRNCMSWFLGLGFGSILISLCCLLTSDLWPSSRPSKKSMSKLVCGDSSFSLTSPSFLIYYSTILLPTLRLSFETSREKSSTSDFGIISSRSISFNKFNLNSGRGRFSRELNSISAYCLTFSFFLFCSVEVRCSFFLISSIMGTCF